MTDDLPWIERSIERNVRYLFHGTHAGLYATAWSDSGAVFDGTPEVAATQVTTVTSGRVLGAYPNLGRVTMTADRTTTEVRIVEEGPVIHRPACGSEGSEES